MNVEAEIVELQTGLLSHMRTLEMLTNGASVNSHTVRMLADIARDHTDRLDMHTSGLMSLMQVVEKMTSNQEKIAGILNSFDDRIRWLEQNQQMMLETIERFDKTLGELQQSLDSDMDILRDSIQELRS